jgi:SAM-dependent methyltransferase
VCNPACLKFAENHLTADRVAGRRVLEVGARDVNGSVRPLVERFAPAEYVGVDVQPGPGVDQVCDIGALVDRFGPEHFDVILCTEVLEHVHHWRQAMDNLKQVLAPGGLLLVTTRSIGFHYHGYPFDFWRYQPEDVRQIMADMTLDLLESDDSAPGVFFLATKPADFAPVCLDEHALFSVILGRRVSDVTDAQWLWFRLAKRPVGRFCKRILRSVRKRLPAPKGPADA